MSPPTFAAIGLQQRVADALRRLDELERAYETITIPQLVSMRARTHGSVTAIDVFGRGERATYSEMESKSNRYAHALRAFGVRKGDHVAVMLPNRIEFPILWFALAKLAAVMIPIYMYTPREIEYVLSDTLAKFAVVDESVWPLFSAIDPWPQSLSKKRVLLVGQRAEGVIAIDDLLDGVDASPVDENVCADDLLNIQYTSGTTGFPKGCMLTHDYWGVGSYAYSDLHFQPYKRYLCWSPFYYMFGQALLIMSYRQGGTLYLAPEINPARFFDWLKAYRIEWCALPKQIADVAADVPECLKQVSQYHGWSPKTIRRFRDQFGVRALNTYGTTEVGCGAQMPLEVGDMDETGSVGLRSPFRALRLVSDNGAPTEVGRVGELWVRGRGIFRGYWNNPRAECFEGEWFKTGDLFRRDELGFYWIVGRKTDVIRRFDENIAAREVEAVLCEIPEIADAAAVPVHDDECGQEVKIYIELKKEFTPADLKVERILEHARERLVAFKVPRYISYISALPRTPSSGKVLKRELTNMNEAGAYDAEKKRWL